MANYNRPNKIIVNTKGEEFSVITPDQIQDRHIASRDHKQSKYENRVILSNKNHNYIEASTDSLGESVKASSVKYKTNGLKRNYIPPVNCGNQIVLKTIKQFNSSEYEKNQAGLRGVVRTKNKAGLRKAPEYY